MIENIKAMVLRFKHYKRIDKRFIDAINAEFPEMRIWFREDRRIIARWQMINDDLLEAPELYIGSYGRNLDWQEIIDDCARYRIEDTIADYRCMLQKYDDDYNKIKQIQVALSELNVINFNHEVYLISQTIKDIIKYGRED